MLCFSLSWVEHLLIQLVILAAVVAIIRLIVPWVLQQIGFAGGVISQAINIALWAGVTIFVIILCFDLIKCLGGV